VERPVVLVDNSIKMLKTAKSRLIKSNGTVPENMAFLQADALRLPFRDKSFDTILFENLLHCLADTKSLLAGLKNILSEDSKMYFTTLVKSNRFADRYIEVLANKGKLVSRNVEDHQKNFNQQ